MAIVPAKYCRAFALSFAFWGTVCGLGLANPACAVCAFARFGTVASIVESLSPVPACLAVGLAGVLRGEALFVAPCFPAEVLAWRPVDCRLA